VSGDGLGNVASLGIGRQVDARSVLPERAVIAEGVGPTGERWIVTGAGTAEDCYTYLRTVYADGRSDEGGFGGPVLHPNRLLNGYTGVGTRGLRRVLARADGRVRQLRVELAYGDPIELQPVARDTTTAMVYFAALLAPSATVAALIGLDATGKEC
jgi:hypothetical protein